MAYPEWPTPYNRVPYSQLSTLYSRVYFSECPTPYSRFSYSECPTPYSWVSYSECPIRYSRVSYSECPIPYSWVSYSECPTPYKCALIRIDTIWSPTSYKNLTPVGADKLVWFFAWWFSFMKEKSWLHHFRLGLIRIWWGQMLSTIRIETFISRPHLKYKVMNRSHFLHC